MNTKLLASIAVFALLAGMIGASVLDSAYAAETPKKDAMKEKKDAIKEKAAAKKDAAKEKATAKKDAAKEKAAAKKDSTSTTGTSSVTVEMAKGTASNTDCGDQCYIPNNAKISAGGTVIWKNVDSAAHTATDTNDSFNTGLVNAGKSFKQKFDTAGTFEYICIVHPWMKGTVTVN
ncbi:MAG: cupredoxin domain-containing protein [Nitrososphaerota archaeon]